MKKLGKIMILLGVLFLLIPMIGSCYTQYQQEKMYEAYIDQQDRRIEGLDMMNEAFKEEIEETAEADVIQKEEAANVASQTLNGVEAIGLISLPKIDVELILVEGVTSKALKYAAGHMPGTALPGEVGNCSIAGHRSYTFGKYFNRLDELEIGDTIEVIYNKTRYSYRVYETFLVEPSEVEVIESQGDKSVITLITCHPVMIATHRLIVRGELVEKIEL